MAPLHQFDYILAIGTIFAFLDAWNIGANDVANSWTTSVSSRSVGYLQAMILASIMEFAGAVGVGARVADTIRTKVVDPDLFEENPAVLMVGMMSAIIGSALWLTFATKISLPVSTTHSIMGGVIGMGVATVGAKDITWVDFSSDDISSGVVSVFLAWIIAPGVAGGFAVVIFLVTKYAVLLRSNPVFKGLCLVPIYFGMTGALVCMLLLWKGGSINTEAWSTAQTVGTIIGVGAGIALLIALFLVPWLYRLVVKDDWQLRWYHIAQGPLLLRRPEPPAQPEGAAGGIQDFYAGHLTRDELLALRNNNNTSSSSDVEAASETAPTKEGKVSDDGDVAPHHDGEIARQLDMPQQKSIVGPRPEGKWFSGAVLFWTVKWLFLRGVDQDIIAQQSKQSRLAGDLAMVHAHVKHYDNKAEYLYTFVQVMTACAAAFVHGANDVANAIAPYATILQVWQEGSLEGSKSPVPIWVLAFGGAGIVIGLWTYGYNLMKALGNRLTLHSPSRGFAMELGATCAVITATQLNLPVSTTQCITGATVGVGLCSGTWRSINWRMVAWIYMGWMVTLPIAGILSGCVCGIIINAPRWGYNPYE